MVFTRRSRFVLLVAGLASVLLAGCNNFSAQGKNAEGVRLYQQARFQEALRQFQEARYDDPNNADAYYNIAATLHQLAQLESRPEDLKQAEHSYRMCLDRNANHRDAYRGLAVLLSKQGRTDESYALLQGWVERQPSSADARIELARLCDEMGEKARAEGCVLEALALQPENARALTALGKLREESGRRSEALAAYQRSYAVDNRQSELATRIASLQGAVYPTAPAGVASPAGTWATGPGAPPGTPAANSLQWR
jgi:tetratricopeptide (TPR) repeat protein